MVGLLTSELEAHLEAAGDTAKAWAKAQDFTADFGQTLSIPNAAGQIETVLFGYGDNQKDALETGAALSKNLPAGAFALSTGFEDIAGIALGFSLASYRFDAYKKKSPLQRRS